MPSDSLFSPTKHFSLVNFTNILEATFVAIYYFGKKLQTQTLSTEKLQKLFRTKKLHVKFW